MKSKVKLNARVVLSEGKNNIMIDDSGLHISCQSISDNLLWFNDALRAYFISFFHTYNGFFFHASSAIINHHAFIFLGSENTGKSTKRKQLSQQTSLGDDVAIVRIINRTPILFGSPFYQKTKINYPNKKYKHPIFCFLEQSEFDMIISIKKPISLISRNIFLIHHTEFINAFHLVATFASFDNHFVYKNTLGNSPTPLLKALLKFNNPSQFSTKSINPKLLNEFKYTIESFGVIMTSSLQHMNVIRGLSWLFEFGEDLAVGSVAKQFMVSQKTITSSHREKIDKFLQGVFETDFYTFPLILSEIGHNTFEIVDGNHRSIANYIKYIRTGINIPIPILLVNKEKV